MNNDEGNVGTDNNQQFLSGPGKLGLDKFLQGMSPLGADEVRRAAAKATGRVPKTKAAALNEIRALICSIRTGREFDDILEGILEPFFAVDLAAWAADFGPRPSTKDDSIRVIIKKHFNRSALPPPPAPEARVTLAPDSAPDVGLLEAVGADEVRGVRLILPSTSDVASTLFGYQMQCIEAVERNNCSGVVHIPTGGGKTRIGVELVARWLRRSPSHRVVWVSHPTVLIRQAMKRFAEQGGVFASGTTYAWCRPRELNWTTVNATQLSFAMQADLTAALDAPARENAFHQAHANGVSILVVYDECHQLGANELQRAWKQRARSSPEAMNALRVIGLSATPLPTQLEQRELLKKTIFPPVKPHEWGMMVHFSIDMNTLVKDGVLCEINNTLQEARVFDFPKSLVDAALGNRRIPANLKGFAAQEEIAKIDRTVMSSDAIIEHFGRRIHGNLESLGKTLVFMPTIDSANRLTTCLQGLGVRVTLAHSKLNEFADSDDDLLDDDFDYTNAHAQITAFTRNPGPSVMVNVGMLTTGFDDPKIQTVILARNTTSLNLYWQMIGRGCRGQAAGGTQYCNVIDPLRLAERFNALRGYLPSINGQDEDPEILDELISKGGVDPHLPIVKIPPRSATRRATISHRIRASVREALIAFLEQGLRPATADVIDVVAVTSTNPAGQVSVELMNKADAPPSAAPASEWFPGIAIEQLQEEISKTISGVDLSWLYSDLPKRNEEDQLNLFRKKLDRVRSDSLFTEELFTKWRLSVY